MRLSNRNKYKKRKRVLILITFLIIVSFFSSYFISHYGAKTKDDSEGIRGDGIPLPDLRLPLPEKRSWLLTVEAGGKAFRGSDDRFHKGAKHFALDFDDITLEDGPLKDVPVLAAGDGKVVSICNSKLRSMFNGSGYNVVIDHTKPYNGTGYRTQYGHLKEPPKVKEGQLVKQGDFIGIMGSTGLSGGTHLHFRLFFNGSSQESFKALQELVLDGKTINEYKVNPSGDSLATYEYYLSTNIPLGAPALQKR